MIDTVFAIGFHLYSSAAIPLRSEIWDEPSSHRRFRTKLAPSSDTQSRNDIISLLARGSCYGDQPGESNSTRRSDAARFGRAGSGRAEPRSCPGSPSAQPGGNVRPGKSARVSSRLGVPAHGHPDCQPEDARSCLPGAARLRPAAGKKSEPGWRGAAMKPRQPSDESSGEDMWHNAH